MNLEKHTGGKCYLDSKGRKIPKSTCPVCGYKPDAATSVDSKETRPKPGDITLCLKCGEIMEFSEEMKLQTASLESLNALQKEKDQWWYLNRAQQLIREQRLLG